MQQFINDGYWWQEQAPTLLDGDWFDVDEELPVNAVHAKNGDVWGLIHERHTSKKSIEKVHFDGSDWYDQNSKTCNVIYWRVLGES